MIAGILGLPLAFVGAGQQVGRLGMPDELHRSRLMRFVPQYILLMLNFMRAIFACEFANSEKISFWC